MDAQDIMTPAANVIVVAPDDSIYTAIHAMLKNRVSGVPVINKSGELVGLVTEGDFLRRAESQTVKQRPRWIEFLMGPRKLADEYVREHGRRIDEVMSSPPIFVAPDASLEEVAGLMERHHIKRMPVVAGKTFVGLITRSDLLRAVVKGTAKQDRVGLDDNRIRERLLEEMQKQPWAPIVNIDVTVHNGSVTLSGVITEPAQRSALLVAAENIPGVVKVYDNLAWLEPLSGFVLEPEKSGQQAKTG